MSTYEILGLQDKNTWNEYLRKFPVERQDIYFTPEYYALHENLGDGKAQCFVFQNETGMALYPFLINSVNDLNYDLNQDYYDIQGAYGYNGVISNTFDVSFIDDFYQAFNNYCDKKNIIAEFTRFHPLLGNINFSQKYLSVYFDRKTVYIDLNQGYDQIFNKFQTNTQKQIKKTFSKYNIDVIKIEKDTSKIDVFLKIYHETMDRVRSVDYLYFSADYFKSLINEVNSTLFIALFEKKPIASTIAIYSKHYIHSHLGGARSNYLYTSIYSRMYEEMIKLGIEKGCRYFDAGGGATKKGDDNLLKFKLHFSPTTSKFYIGKCIRNKKVYNSVVNQWSKKCPSKISKHNNLILKYRY